MICQTKCMILHDITEVLGSHIPYLKAIDSHQYLSQKDKVELI